MLTVCTSDLMPWKRPIHAGSYSVFRPNGTLMPTPKFQRSPKSMAKNALGTYAVSPASPPLPLRAGLLAVAMVLPLSLNFQDGWIAAAPTEICIPLGRRDMPAGFHHTVVASSAVAAAPA